MESLNESIYYTPETLKILHEIFDNLSPEFWHHLNNPWCAVCLEARGREFLANPKRTTLEQIW